MSKRFFYSFNTSATSNTLGNIFTNGANVGIGTTSPQYKLDVKGIVNVSDNITKNNAGSALRSVVTANTSSTLTTTLPTSVVVSGQSNNVTGTGQSNQSTIVLGGNSTGNLISVYNAGTTVGNYNASAFVSMGTSTTSGSVARLRPGDSINTIALNPNDLNPTQYQTTIIRKSGNAGRGLSSVVWTERATPGTRNWSGVDWAPQLGLFCAVNYGTAAVVMTSPDAVNWVESAIPNNRNWSGLVWSPQLRLFCAVNYGSAAVVMTSANGVSWTERAIPNARNWSAIAWAQQINTFCAINYNSAAVVMTSSNGINWTERAIPTSRNWQSIVWAPELGLFCAVNYGSAAVVMTSPNGINWTERAIPNARNWRSITWSRDLGMFCAITYGGAAVVMTSYDGVNWTERSIPNARNWSDISWSSELKIFCAINSGSAAVVMTSPDGVNWTERAIPSNRAWNSICWSREIMAFSVVQYGSSNMSMTSYGIQSNFVPAPTSTTLGTTASLTTNTITYNLTNYFSDTTATGMVYIITANPYNNASIVGNTLSIISNYRATSYTVTVQAINGYGKISSASLTVNEGVAPNPGSSSMGSTASLTTNSVTYNVASYFTDSTGTGLTYSLTANPQSSASLVGTTLTVTGNNRNTSYTVTVQAINGYGKTATSSLTVNEGNNIALYTFTSHTFTNAGVTGRNGPTLTQIQSAYSSQTWAQNTSYLNMTTQGIQKWTVPNDGNYAVTIGGAKGSDVVGTGNNRYGGNGRIITGTIALTKSQILQLIVGQIGLQQTGQLGYGVVSLTTASGAAGGGGGGGSFIVDNSNNLILAAGGGGGAKSDTANSRFYNGIDAPQSQYGTTMTGTIKTADLGNGGTIGAYSIPTNGDKQAGGGGGTGWLTNGWGATGPIDTGGFSLQGGPSGGTKYQGGIANYFYGYGINNGDGGFGGGGGGGNLFGGASGGGGGYSGGDGGYDNGGGAGSYIGSIGSYAGTNNGVGFITIVKL